MEVGALFSSKSSLASPVSLRHSLEQGGRRVNSTVSLESERYYSAEEEVVSSSENVALCDDTVLFLQDSVDVSKATVLEKTRGEDKDGTLKSRDSRRGGDSDGRKLTDDKDVTLRPKNSYRKPFMEDCDDDDADDDYNVSSATSSSSSTSTLSYTSAPSEQDFDSDETPEDFTLVHLHTHLNQPITHSPLLLNCYMRHLSQFQCHDWLCPGPSHTIYPIKKGLRSVQSEYSLSSASHSMYSATSSWMPHFTKVA